MIRQRLSAPYTHKSLFLVLMVLALLLPAFTPSHSLAEEKEKPGNPNSKVVKKVKLKPKKDAQVLIPDFELTMYDDGTRVVRAGGNTSVDAPTLAFEFEVDPVAETYTTKVVDASKFDAQGIDNSSSIAPKSAGGMQAQAVSIGDAWGRVRVIGRDPVWIVVTQTTSELSWRVGAAGSLTTLGFVDGCYAANPTRAGTRWFTTNCPQTAPQVSSGIGIMNYTEGRYENWDWIDPNKATNVWQRIWLDGRTDRTFNYTWEHIDWGESALNIWGGVAIN